VCNAAADEVDAADDFMARNDRIFDAGKLGIDDMKVGPANPTRAYLDANFSLAGAGVCPFLHLERRLRGRKHHRAHTRFSKQGTEPERALQNEYIGQTD
jgi:hypothetical protein